MYRSISALSLPLHGILVERWTTAAVVAGEGGRRRRRGGDEAMRCDASCIYSLLSEKSKNSIG